MYGNANRENKKFSLFAAMDGLRQSRMCLLLMLMKYYV